MTQGCDQMLWHGLRPCHNWLGLLAGGLLAVLALSGPVSGQEVLRVKPKEASETPSLEDTLKKASVDGKYANLLVRIEVCDDMATYTAFRDYGFYSGSEYAGYANLPEGYWVYLYPHWYIWHDLGSPPKQHGER